MRITNIKKSTILVFLVLMMALIIIMTFCFIQTYASANAYDDNTSDTSILEAGCDEEMPKENNGSTYEFGAWYFRDELISGTWKIVDLLVPDFGLPSSYSGIDEEGNVRGPDYTAILGKELTFGYDYVEYEGEKHYLVYGYRSYSYALLSDEERIGYYYAKTLDITGSYYSKIYYLLPENSKVTGSNMNGNKKMCISDLCWLFLKDNNTIYASDGTLAFRLERVSTD